MGVIRKLSLIVPIAALGVGGCDGHLAPPDARDHAAAGAVLMERAPTLDDAAAATYLGGKARKITLTGGVYTGTKGERVELLRQHYAVADLEGDGAVDAVVALAVSNAGEESGQYLAVLRHFETGTISLGTTFLGADARLRALSVRDKRIVVDLERSDAPIGQTREIYELARGQLVKSVR